MGGALWTWHVSLSSLQETSLESEGQEKGARGNGVAEGEREEDNAFQLLFGIIRKAVMHLQELRKRLSICELSKYTLYSQ